MARETFSVGRAVSASADKTEIGINFSFASLAARRRQPKQERTDATSGADTKSAIGLLGILLDGERRFLSSGLSRASLMNFNWRSRISSTCASEFLFACAHSTSLFTFRRRNPLVNIKF